MRKINNVYEDFSVVCKKQVETIYDCNFSLEFYEQFTSISDAMTHMERLGVPQRPEAPGLHIV